MDSKIMPKPEVYLAQLACHKQTGGVLSGGKGGCEWFKWVGGWLSGWRGASRGMLEMCPGVQAHLCREDLELRFQLHLGPRRQNVEVEGDVDILHLGPATFRAPGP